MISTGVPVGTPKLFYFAGHGLSINGSLHICGADFDGDIAEKSGIDVSEIVLEFCRVAPWAVFIFDCCRSPLNTSFERSVRYTGGGIRVLENALVMFACSQGEYSYEAASVDGHNSGGIFTHFVCKAIEKEFKRGRKARVAIADIFNFARDATTEYVLAKAGKAQNPRMIGAQGTDFYLVR
jgi:hypothetical protein